MWLCKLKQKVLLALLAFGLIVCFALQVESSEAIKPQTPGPFSDANI